VAASHHADTPYNGKSVTPVPVTPYTTSADVNAACPEMTSLAALVCSFAALLKPDPGNEARLKDWTGTARACDLPHLHVLTRGQLFLQVSVLQLARLGGQPLFGLRELLRCLRDSLIAAGARVPLQSGSFLSDPVVR